MGTEQNILAKFMTAKYLLVAKWMASVITIILNIGTFVSNCIPLKLTRYPLHFQGSYQ